MERGFGFLEPGWLRQVEEDEGPGFSRVWRNLLAAYPAGECPEYRWFVVFRGSGYVARSYEEAQAISRRIANAHGIPEYYAPRPECLHPVARPSFKRKPVPEESSM